MQQKYFPDNDSLWEKVGLPSCQVLAEVIHNSRLKFESLDAAQLLKHMLGLAHQQQPWVLCYLWYDPGVLGTEIHYKELDQFKENIGDNLTHFCGVSYQDLFNRISDLLGQDHSCYLKYLKDRYFKSNVV